MSRPAKAVRRHSRSRFRSSAVHLCTWHHTHLSIQRRFLSRQRLLAQDALANGTLRKSVGIFSHGLTILAPPLLKSLPLRVSTDMPYLASLC
jgi:hypothetical protein